MNEILVQAYEIAKLANVDTPENCAVLYSISYQPTKENKIKAMEYVKNNFNYFTLDDTECGKKLIQMGLETGNKMPNTELLKIWAIASERFIMSASGNITAFVDNANKNSTFVQVELPNILKNKHIATINNIDKYKYAQKFL